MRRVSVGISIVALMSMLVLAAGFHALAATPAQSDNSPASLAQLQNLAGGGLKIAWNQRTGVPKFILGQIPLDNLAPTGADPVAKAMAFFKAYASVFKLKDVNKELSFRESVSDRGGVTHLRFQQYYQGIKVYGGELAVHLKGQTITAVNGDYTPEIAVSPVLSVTNSQAEEVARNDLASQPTQPPNVADSAKKKPSPAVKAGTEHLRGGPVGEGPIPLEAIKAAAEKTEVVVFNAPDGPHLVWQVHLVGDKPVDHWVYFVDAHSGAVIYKFNAVESARSRLTYTMNNGWAYPGTLLINEGGSSSDGVAQAAHDNIGLGYDYYWNTFGRDSFDDAGAVLESNVHLGTDYNNAFWDPTYQAMFYGDGDGTEFSPLGNALDVVGHELTHGVTEHTSNLAYHNQSGALNESYSDVFATMIDRDDWLVGEDVYTPGVPGDALRSLSDPTLYYQPDHVNDFVVSDDTEWGDWGGVHTNSGIINKAAYSLASAIGRDETEQIWYSALTNYLTADSDFGAARLATLAAASDLYGSPSTETTAVEEAFAAVGLTDVIAESPHPYANNYSNTWIVTNPDINATSTQVHFSALSVEDGYDAITILDGSNNVIQEIAGNQRDLLSAEVPGRTVKVRLSSDSSVVYWGFTIDQVVTPSTTSYPVSVSANPSGGGTVSPGSGDYSGDTTFTATPGPGYRFVKWTIDGTSGATTNPLTLNIATPTSLVANFTNVAITTGSLPNGTVGSAYTTNLVASGGSPPYQWALTSGPLPDGLNLAPATGIISGEPGTAGTFDFVVGVTDSASISVTKSLSITVEPGTAEAPTIHWTSPTTDGQAYSASSGQVPLEVSATGASGIHQVRFDRWDAANFRWVAIATVSSAPYAASLDLGTLNMGWNQVNATATDNASQSVTEHIWIDRTGPQSYVYLPVVMKNAYGGWTTAAHIQNKSRSQAAAVTLDYYDTGGAKITSQSASIQPQGLWSVSQANSGLPDNFAGSAIVRSEQPLSAIVNEMPVSGDAMSYEGQTEGATTTYLPVVLNGAYGGWTTGVNLVNVGASPANVIITYYDQDGRTVGTPEVKTSLAPNAYWAIYEGGVGLPANFAGSARITSSQPIVATVNEINYGSAKGGGAMSYTGISNGANTLYVPVVMNNAYGGWTTGINLRNVGPGQASVTITYFDNNGNQMAKKDTGTLAVNGYWGVYQGGGQLPDDFAGSARIDSSQPIVAITNEINYISSGAMSYDSFSRGSSSIYLPVMENGYQGVTTGVNIKNLGGSGLVTISYFNANGTLAKTESKTLEAGGYWGVYQGAGQLPDGFWGAATITSPQPLVAIVNQICEDGKAMSYGGVAE